MTQRSITYLKARFENNDIPAQSDYGDVFDSFVSLESSASQTMAGTLIVPVLETPKVSAAKVIRGYSNFSAEGTTQASATRVTTDFGYILANDDDRAVVLATCEPGRTQVIVNTNTTTISVFPASGGNFVGTAENAGLLLAKLTTMVVSHVTTSAYAIIRGSI